MQTTVTQEILHNPHSGDKLLIVRDAASTAGKFLEVEAIYQPAKEFAPEHFHPTQEEQFTVLSGKLMTKINGITREYTAGESFSIPARTPHAMYNAGTEEVHFRWKIEPALHTEFFFRSVYQAASQQKQPHLVDIVWVVKDFQKKSYLQRFLPTCSRLFSGLFYLY